MDAQNVRVKLPRKNLTSVERKAVFLFLTSKCGGEKILPPGTLKEAATKYSCSTSLISKIWTAGKQHKADELQLLAALSPKRKGRCGRKRRVIPVDLIKNLPAKKRRTVRALGRNSGIPKSTVHDHITKFDDLVPHSNTVHPYLTRENEVDRLKYDLAQIVPESIPENPQFEGFYNDVHVDEKWFELSEVSQKVILAKGEPPPYRACKSKKFMPKIMFLCANARPRFHPETGECLFDGKLGIWPFVEKVPAQRSSANRPRGTLITTPVTVTRLTYGAMLENELIPAILTKFPDLDAVINIQQDNARPHIHPDDPQFLAAAAMNGLQLRLKKQSPNSPDQNINDLGFFASIESHRQEETSNSLDELIAHVKQAYENYSPETLDHVWISYQQCMIKCMEERGSNKYTLPHMGKAKLARLGLLPRTLHIPIALVNEIQQIVDNEDSTSEKSSEQDD